MILFYHFMLLHNALGLQISLINNVLRPLMNYSIDRTSTVQSFDDLDMIREEVLDNINSTIQGTMSANLTKEMIRYFIEGISAYYVNLTFNIGAGGILVITPTQRTCANNAIYQHLFPPVEQGKIASLGNSLQQIAVAYEVAGAVSVQFCSHVAMHISLNVYIVTFEHMQNNF